MVVLAQASDPPSMPQSLLHPAFDGNMSGTRDTWQRLDTLGSSELNFVHTNTAQLPFNYDTYRPRWKRAFNALTVVESYIHPFASVTRYPRSSSVIMRETDALIGFLLCAIVDHREIAIGEG